MNKRKTQLVTGHISIKQRMIVSNDDYINEAGK